MRLIIHLHYYSIQYDGKFSIQFLTINETDILIGFLYLIFITTILNGNSISIDKQVEYFDCLID